MSGAGHRGAAPGPVAVAERSDGGAELRIAAGDGPPDVVVLDARAARELGLLFLDAGRDDEPGAIDAVRVPGVGERLTLQASTPPLSVAVDRAGGEWVLQPLPPDAAPGAGAVLDGAQARLLGAALLAAGSGGRPQSPTSSPRIASPSRAVRGSS